jgi:peptidyl-prolyl cis-trans isomerase B (cyclophilin B)
VLGLLPQVVTADEQASSKKAFDKVAVVQTSMGTFTVEFFRDVAPAHVDSFIARSLDGFYAGTKFHRVEPGFVIQGGDPNSKDKNPNNDGQGGPGYKLKAEFNDRPHRLGTLSMARSRDPNSAGSQFFICLSRERCAGLDRQYTVFGEVIDGVDVVEDIGRVKVKRMSSGMQAPMEPITLESVTVLSRKEWEAKKAEKKSQ